MERHCSICKKQHDLFTLKFEADETDAGEEFSKYVCGSCWEVIAAIARRVARNITSDLEKKVAALLDAVPSAKVQS